MSEGLEEEITIGLLDLERLRKLNDINHQIEEATSQGLITYNIVKKALKAALLARGMEKPRSEVQGLFDRALKLTAQYGNEEQLFDVKYNNAWTAYFWYEDFDLFISLYDDLEQLAINSENIYTVERLNNLWQILKTLSSFYEKVEIDFLKQKTESIKIILTKFSINESKPSAALQAKALLTINELLMEVENANGLKKIFGELSSIIKEAQSLIGFPYESFYDIIQELGDVFGGNAEYESLLNTIIEVDIKRKGEIPAALSFLRFGKQHFDAGRYYKSIDYLGRSLSGLYKQESKREFVIVALYFIGLAYENAGAFMGCERGVIDLSFICCQRFLGI